MAGKGRPGPVPTGHNFVNITISLRPEQVEWLRETAKEGCGPFARPSVSAVIQSLISEAMGK